MKQGAVTLDSFKYLGLSTVVEEDEPAMKLTYILQEVELTGDAGDKYIGLDRFGRVSDQKWLENSTGSTLDDYQYAYDRDSNVVAKTNGVLGSFSETYTYSGLSQLTAVARGTNSQAFGVTSIGDITSITTNGTTLNHTVNSANQITTITNGTTLNHTVNSANQITTITGGTSLTYDANGNLLTDDQGEVLRYDGWNRLVSVASTTGTMIATYSYDGAGDLISQTEGGTATDLYYSGSQDIETRTGVTSTSSGTMATNTIYSPEYQNDVLARDSGGTRVYFTHDANYDVTAVISTAGAVDQRMAYDAYGKVSILTNGGSLTTDGYDLTHLWQGGLRDAATGMYHFGARWYSTTLQSWMSMDPARAGMNWYEPDAGNPINHTDPTGLKVNWSAWDYRTAKYDPHGVLEVTLTGGAGETYASHFHIAWYPDKTVTGYTGKWKGGHYPACATEVRFIQYVEGFENWWFNGSTSYVQTLRQPDKSKKGFYGGEAPFYWEQTPWTPGRQSAEMWDSPMFGDGKSYQFWLSEYTRRFLTLVVVYSGPEEGTILGAVIWRTDFYRDYGSAVRSVNAHEDSKKIGEASTIYVPNEPSVLPDTF